MSEEICHRDQDRLDYIFEQVKALSDVVDELRTEVNDLKKVSLKARREDISFERTKVNYEINRVGPCAIGNVRIGNVKDLTATEEICRLAGNGQIFKSHSTPRSCMVQSKRERDQEPPSFSSSRIILPTIYNGLKSFKSKLIKILHNIPAPQLFLKNTKDNCATCNKQGQIRFLRKEEKRKIFESNRTNENDVSKCIDIKQFDDDSTNTSLVSNASTQADITICSCQEDDKKTTNIAPISPLLLMSNNRLINRSNRVTDESSKGRAKRDLFSKIKSKKYKICSCGSQCPYALYKLPCCDRDNLLKKKIGEFECSSLEERNNFPKFVNIEARREDERKDDCLVGLREENESSSTSSLSVDLEVDVCESSGRTIMIYVTRGTRRSDDAIDSFRTENKLPLCVNLEANRQGYRTRTEDFTHDYRLISSSRDKQVQCSPATLRGARGATAKTSTPDFRRGDSANRSSHHQMITRKRILKATTPRRLKMNMHTQTQKLPYFNRPPSIDLSNALDLGNQRDVEDIDEDGNKKILRARNTWDLPKQKAWPRADEYDTRFALQVEENDEINSNTPCNKMGHFSYQHDRGRNPFLRTFCPYHCDRLFAEKHENLTTLMRFTEYHHPPQRMLNVDMSNVSGRLYGCLEKVEDITTG